MATLEKQINDENYKIFVLFISYLTSMTKLMLPMHRISLILGITLSFYHLFVVSDVHFASYLTGLSSSYDGNMSSRS